MMKPFIDYLRHLGAPRVDQPPAEPIAPEVHADLRTFLVRRRAFTDFWFFLVRLLIALGVLGYLVAGIVLHGADPYYACWVAGYIVINVGLHVASFRGFQEARWGYAGLDFVAIVMLRYHFQVGALLDPNATMMGVFSLLLIAYVHYSDIRLTSVMVVTVLVMTVLTLWLNVLVIVPTGMLSLRNAASYSAQPLPAMLLLSYLAAVSVLTHRLVHRLYAQLLRYSQEQHKRTKAAVVSAVERSKRERLEELNQLKHNFITVLSHELRNPVTPLLSSLDILHDELNGEADGQEMLGIAREAAERIRRIVTDYTRLAELITMDDEALLRWNVRLEDLVNLLEEQSAKKPNLIGRFDDLVVCTDPRLFSGAMLALMRRAEMLTPPDAEITLRGYQEKSGDVIVSIHDPASFLEAQTIDALDDPFLLSEERAFAQQPSTGLELILARNSLRRLGGVLEIDSAPDRGTTVHCVLPGQQPGTRWLTHGELRRELGVA